MDAINAAVAALTSIGVVAALTWLVGSPLLRLAGGCLLAFAAAVLITEAVSGQATAGTYVLVAANAAVGATLWLAGHLLFALRHRWWKSALTHRLWRGIARPLEGREH